MKKLNKAQKKLIKEKVMKILHIICYILSVLFILTMVIVGVQSCQKQPKKQSAETEYQLPHKAINIDPSEYYVYELIRKINFSIDSASQNSLNELYDIPLGECNYDDPQIAVNLIDSENNGYYKLFINDVVFNLKRLTAVFAPREEINYYYRFISLGWTIYLENGGTDSGSIYTYTGYDSANYASTYYRSGYNIDLGTLLITKDIATNDRFLYWYRLCNQSSFSFNKVFNYNASLGTNINGCYGDAIFDSAGENMRYINYDVGYFLSNGQLFNRIQYWAIQSAGNDIYTDGSIISAPSGHWIYSFIYYINSITGKEVLVNYHDLVPNPKTTTSKYYANSCTWVVDDYRNILFLNDLSQTLKDKINAFNNNNQNSYNGYIGSGDVTNVFSLVGSAFSGLLPILSTYLLPGITIGMLLFIPLVAMLVFAIIRIIKK